MQSTFMMMVVWTVMVVALLGQDKQPPRDVDKFTNSIGMTFVLINPGSFKMGSSTPYDDEMRVHEVTLSHGFYLQTTEVTQAQWQVVMGANPSEFKGPERPVDNVSCNDVQEFLKKLSAKEKGARYRLPTEAEWEYACRAGGQEPDEPANLDEVAWWQKNSGRQTHAVGLKKPNAWGLYDMRGNVEEWVQDWFGPYSAESQIDPQGPARGKYRVFRNGAYYNDLLNPFFNCSYRRWASLGFRGSMGFRCVKPL